MFLKIAWFEIRFWLRSWMVWIFLFIIALLIFGAVSSDQIQVGGALSNTYRNAPFVIQNFYSLIGLLTLLMSTAFVNSSAIRDFKYNTYQIVFTTPLRKIDFLLGRFIGATLISVIPMLGVSLATCWPSTCPGSIPNALAGWIGLRICAASMSSLCPMPSSSLRSCLRLRCWRAMRLFPSWELLFS